jgi:hypothetical protein
VASATAGGGAVQSGQPPLPVGLEQTNLAYDAAAQVVVSGTSPDDQRLVGRALTAMQHSSVGGAVADQLEADHIRVQVLSDQQIQAMSPGAVSFYQHSSQTIFLPRSVLQQSALVGASTLTHEGTHALIDHDGLLLQAMQHMSQGGALSSAQLDERSWEISFANEVQAHMREAQAAHDLGLRPPQGQPAYDTQTGTIRNFHDTWRTLESSTDPGYAGYNSNHYQASDADIAYFQQLFGGVP